MQLLTSLPLCAAGFASGAMLGWAAAAAIPLLIHLLTRRRQRSIPWAAMRLLRDVIEAESKRVRFEQLLLLLLRVAVLCVLALALARPYLRDPQASTDGNSAPVARLWIVAVDVSYSMGYRDGDKSRIQLAREAAAEVIQAGRQGDAYALIEIGAPARARIRQPTFDQALALREVRQLPLLDTNSDVFGAFTLASDIVAEAQRDERLPSEVHSVFISDAGKDAWEPVLQADQREQVVQLSEASNLRIINLAAEKPQNTAITALLPSTFRTLTGQPLTLAARVENFSALDVRQLPVQLKVAGKALESKYVDIPANSAANLSFSYTPNSLGMHVLEASLGKDNLAADNHRSVVISVEDQHRILFVERTDGSTRFLQLALAPEFGGAKQSPFQTTSKIELLSLRLDDWDAIVVDDLATIDGLLLERLTQYVRAGGCVILNFGEHANASSWNAGPVAAQLLGFQLEQPSSRNLWTIDPLEYRSPIAAVFSGYPESGLLTTPIFRYWRIVPRAEELVRDLAVQSGDPLIVRHRLQRGWVASILSAPNAALVRAADEGRDSWNAMAAWPSFVPLLSQLMHTLLNANADEFNVLVGQSLQGEQVSADISSVDVIGPDGVESKVMCSPLPDASSAGWQYDATQRQGVYHVRPPDGASKPYAVNLNPVESSLQSVDLGQLPTEPANARAPSTGWQDADPQLGIVGARWLLIALLGLLVLESTLAWVLGRRIG